VLVLKNHTCLGNGVGDIQAIDLRDERAVDDVAISGALCDERRGGHRCTMWWMTGGWRGWHPTSVTVSAFFWLLTCVNTMRCTRARSCPFSNIGIITSGNSAFFVTSCACGGGHGWTEAR